MILALTLLAVALGVDPGIMSDPETHRDLVGMAVRDAPAVVIMLWIWRGILRTQDEMRLEIRSLRAVFLVKVEAIESRISVLESVPRHIGNAVTPPPFSVS